MQETPVRFLGWEDPLEKGQAIHSSILGLPLWLTCEELSLLLGILWALLAGFGTEGQPAVGRR